MGLEIKKEVLFMNEKKKCYNCGCEILEGFECYGTDGLEAYCEKCFDELHENLEEKT